MKSTVTPVLGWFRQAHHRGFQKPGLRQDEEGRVRLELGLKGSEQVWEWRPWKEGGLEQMRTLYQTLQAHDRGRWLKVEQYYIV